MLFTISTTHIPATDLGYLLHKNPARLHSKRLTFGTAHLFYTEATNERCTAALMLQINSVDLVRSRRGPEGEGGALMQYVNDRPYCASSFMSVAIAEMLGTAMSGRSKERQALADTAIEYEVRIPTLVSRGGESLIRRCFEPLGYEISLARHPLDSMFPAWGDSPYYTTTLRGTVRIADLLRHLYVLLPVLDSGKHYWVAKDEVEKLVSKGADWLPSHPEKDMIVRRYLKHQHSLVRSAFEQLLDEDQQDADETAERQNEEEEVVEKSVSLNELRHDAVMQAIQETNPTRVLDLGCGEGKLIRRILKIKSVVEIVGMDVSLRALEIALDRLRYEKLPRLQQDRIKLIQGSLSYVDERLLNFDVAALVEVIEHMDPPRLFAFEESIFGHARPRRIVITTPNSEYNVRWPALPAGNRRHRDHRFEWTREEFRQWADRVAHHHGYKVEYRCVGPDDTEVGPPTQMAVFDLC